MNECKVVDEKTREYFQKILNDVGENKTYKKYMALGEPVRLSLYLTLLEDELCVCQIENMTGMPQSTVSGHLKKLLEADLIEGRREGKWIYYRSREWV